MTFCAITYVGRGGQGVFGGFASAPPVASELSRRIIRPASTWRASGWPTSAVTSSRVPWTFSLDRSRWSSLKLKNPVETAKRVSLTDCVSPPISICRARDGVAVGTRFKMLGSKSLEWVYWNASGLRSGRYHAGKKFFMLSLIFLCATTIIEGSYSKLIRKSVVQLA